MATGKPIRIVSRLLEIDRTAGSASWKGEMAMEGCAAKKLEKYKSCADLRECSLTECIFYDGSDNGWSPVSPFRMSRGPSPLLEDTAERCLCLLIPCAECEHYEG
jgi:hypothetical protein